MDVLVVFGLWAAAMLLAIVTLLFGQNPAMAHTPLPKLHWLLTEGLGASIRRAGGRHGTAALERAGQLCCERSNPTVQIIFIVLVVGCYSLFCAYVFPMLPLPGIPAWHKYSGTAAALATLALFAAASFADPGTVTAANLAAHQALYPYDGLVYPEAKDCWTCGVPRPARSKHCSTCGRCIARLDHHCIWLNSCVGLGNTRWFLAFLLATAALCSYGAALGYITVQADMAARGTWGTAFIHPGTEGLVYLTDSYRYLWAYLSSTYGPQVAATFFAGAAGWIVFGFTAYQLWLICSGVTTSELLKRRQVALALDLQEEEAEVEARVERALAKGRPSAYSDGGAAAAEDGRHTASISSQQQQGKQRRRSRRQLPNHYDRGPLRNLAEVLFPEFYLRHAHTLALAGGGKKGA